MQQKFLTYTKSGLLKPENVKPLFFHFLNYLEIKECKKMPEFEQLKNTIIALNITPNEIFQSVAITVVKKGKLATLSFLIDECGYALKNLADPEGMTLLHEACLRGNLEIVSYLLKKGFDPNQKDAQGQTALHAAIISPHQENAVKIITLLHQYKANLNAIETENNLTPLHLAAIWKNKPARGVLIDLKANRKIKCNSLTHLEFEKNIENGTIENLSPAIDLSISETSLSEKAILEYYKGCFSPKFHSEIFQNTKSWLMKSTKKLSQIETFALIDTFLLTTPFPCKVETLTSSLLNLIKKDKSNINDLLKGTLSLSSFLVSNEEENAVELAIQLNQFIVDQLQTTTLSDNNCADIYYVLGIIYRNAGRIKEAEKCLLNAISYSNQKTDEEKSLLFYNLGCVRDNLLKFNETLEDFEKAFYLNSTDTNNFGAYVRALLKNQDYDKAQKVCQMSHFSDSSKYWTHLTNFFSGKLSADRLLKTAATDFSPDEKSPSFSNEPSENAKLVADQKASYSADLKYVASSELDNKSSDLQAKNKEAFVLAEKAYAQDQDYPIENKIFRILDGDIKAKEYKKALIFAEENAKKYPFVYRRNLFLMIMMTELYNVNGDHGNTQKILEKINLTGVESKKLVTLYHSLALNAQRENNYSASLSYLDLATKIDPDYFPAWKSKFLIFVLLKDLKNAAQISEYIHKNWNVDLGVFKDLEKDSPSLDTSSFDVLENKDKEEEEEQAEEDSEEQPLKLELEKYDPIKIEQYWNVEKERLEKEKAQKLSLQPQPKTAWKVGAVSFEEGQEGMVPVFHPQYPNCYAIIHPLLKLDPALLKKAQSALKNEDIHLQQLSSNLQDQKTARKRNSGIQTLNNSLVQLKIVGTLGKERLWTNKVYLIDGKHLLVFENCDNHPAIKRKAKKPNLMQVINLEKTSPSIPNNRGAVFTPIPSSSTASTNSSVNALNFQ